MSIVKMKRFRMLAMRDDREKLIKELQKLGCMQITEHEAGDEARELGLARGEGERLLEFRSELTRVSAALKLLDKYAYVKTGLFPALPEVKLSRLFDDELPAKADEVLSAIEQGDAALARLYAEEGRLHASITALELWRGSGIPLDVRDSENVAVWLGTIPAARPADSLVAAVGEITDEAQIIKTGSDRDQQGIAAVFHKAHTEEIAATLRSFGFSRSTFEGCSGAAEDNIHRFEERLREISAEQETEKAKLKELGAQRELLKLYYDRLQQEIEAETAKGELIMSERTFLLEGWVAAPELPRLEKLLDSYCCAYEARDPEPEEDVPVQLKSNRITRPLNMVTEMYSLPKYTNVDPNPLIAFWFCVFFGIMYADVGYGLVLLLLGLIIGPKIKRPGTLKYMTGLLVECGITTFIFGWLFGSFFGDSLDYFSGFLGCTLDMSKVPLWGIKNPNTDPMWFMYASLVVGALHLLCGMVVKVVILIRDGKPLDALFDVGSWWLLFAGIGVGVLKGNWWVALAGALALVLTQGREKPTIIGKFVGGLKSLYDITSWLGDILSYTRLMALMLAGGVIAQVFNMLGNMAGSAVPSKILGLIVFLLIFVVTQLFNMAINIIGTFVHAARLQYLEFFNRFYEDGGKPFKPFKFKTKYTEIIKEEN
ncbi:MAG: V-type ATP synthase subunit I [Clostridiales bacterium]|nr:V-type ATP synthase subunit I [Clostridiales bacterium]